MDAETPQRTGREDLGNTGGPAGSKDVVRYACNGSPAKQNKQKGAHAHPARFVPYRRRRTDGLRNCVTE
jgi:hypothetical protein